MSISTVVLTKNSEKTVGDTLSSLTWCDEIIIIDDSSADNTLNIAKKFNTKVYQRALSGDFSAQRNFGLEKAQSDWILFIDSDEIISSSLKEEIELRIKNYELSTNGYFIKRVDTMWGRKLQYGETGNMWLLRLAKKNAGRWQGKVHEVWNVKGKKGRLTNPLSHFPHPTIHAFLVSIQKYSTIRAQELYERHVRVNWLDILMYPKLKFFVNFIVKQGFKDGTVGFLVAAVMSFYSFLVRGKLWQLQNSHT